MAEIHGSARVTGDQMRAAITRANAEDGEQPCEVDGSDAILSLIESDIEAFMRDEPSHIGEVIGKMYAEAGRPIPCGWNVGGKKGDS